MKTEADLGVVVFDTATLEVTAAGEERTASVLLLANAVHDGSDDESSPRSPEETETVVTELGGAVIVLEAVATADKGGCNDGDSGRMEDETEDTDKVGDGGSKTTAAGNEAREEGNGVEEEGHDEEDPAEAPQVVGGSVGGVSSLGALETIGDVLGVAVPGVAEGVCGLGLGAVGVSGSADVEVSPLAYVFGTGDALGLSLEEVGLVERGDIGDTGEDDEEKHQDGRSHHDEADEADDWTLCHCEGVVLCRSQD